MRSSEDTLDAITDLDVALLKDHTEAAGDQFERDDHRRALEERFECAEIATVWRNDRLIAYSFIWPKDDRWFVGGFAIHPAHRNAAILGELFWHFLDCTKAGPQTHVESHVYKTNRLSIDFHRKLGFEIIQENEKGVAFSQNIDVLQRHPIVQRAIRRVRWGGLNGP